MPLQTVAALDKTYRHLKRKRAKIAMVKTPAGASMSVQVNDKSKMHVVLKQCFKTRAYRYDDGVPDPESPAGRSLKAVLQKYLDGECFKAYWKFLKHIPDFL